MLAPMSKTIAFADSFVMRCDVPFALHPKPAVQKPLRKNLAFVFANHLCDAAQPLGDAAC